MKIKYASCKGNGVEWNEHGELSMGTSTGKRNVEPLVTMMTMDVKDAGSRWNRS